MAKAGSDINAVEETGSTSSRQLSPKGEFSTLKSWIYLATISTTTLLSWGIITSFPILFVTILETFDGNRANTSAVGSLQIGLLYIFSLIPGFSIPKYGFRINIAVGGSIMSLGFILSTFAKNIYQLYFTIGVLTSLGASFTMVAADTAPVVVYKQYRSLVNVICHSFIAVGMTIFPIIVDFLENTYGPKGTLLLMGGISLQFLVLAWFFPPNADALKDSTVSKESGLPTKQKYLKLIKTPVFWCLIAGGIAIEALFNGAWIFLLDRIMQYDIPKQKAVHIMAFWGIFGIIGTWIVLLPLVNKTSKRRQTFLVIVLLNWAIITLVSTSFNSFLELFIYSCIAGLCCSLSYLLWYLVLADTIDNRLVVEGYSLQVCFAAPFVLIATPLSGFMFDMTGSYTTPVIVYGCCGLVGGAVQGLVLYFGGMEQV